jgi:Domain of Unknown Function with PDB structure (DUF3857)
MPNEINFDATETNAKNSIRTGPVPGWVGECAFDAGFKNEHHNQLTYLLFDRQIHAERREFFEHTAIRLETLEAVQHQSQWRWQFEPRTQTVILHFLKIHRNGIEINHLDLEKGHLLQREEGLDRLIIHGWFTFLLVLEDVRVGDILEWAVTTETKQQLLPENYFSFFTLPEWVSVGRYHYTARFNPARSMQWKTSAPDLKPIESNKEGLKVWTWAADKYVGLKREPHTPTWYVSAPWIQISDCSDWQTVSAAISEAWSKQEDLSNLDEIINDIEKRGADLLSRIEIAVQLIQDEYRYFSVNLEFGGQIPSPPNLVARRRYGDCKDLSFLLVNLLKRLGVQARPILVHTGLRRSVGMVLPAPVFNHVIVEFEVDGKRRWVDATKKRQGGGALNRIVDEFNLGLQVDPAAKGLVESPKIPEQSNLYEMHETILLDTTGAPSLISMVVRAEGAQAEVLRHQFETTGLEEVKKQELQHCANRFSRATRVGTLQYRDDRATNQFFLAQTFEINGFLIPITNRRFCQFKIPSYWITNLLIIPEKKARRTPFALPNKLQITHTIDIESPALNPNIRQASGPRSELQNDFIKFNRKKKIGHGYWMTTFSVNINEDSVPVDQLEKHRDFVQQVWKQSLWQLTLPLGYSKPKPKRGFGELPQLPRTPIPEPKVEVKTFQVSAPHKAKVGLKEAVIVTNDTLPVKPRGQTKPPPGKKERRGRSQRTYRRRALPLWLIIIITTVTFGIFFLLVLLVVTNKTGR